MSAIDLNVAPEVSCYKPRQTQVEAKRQARSMNERGPRSATNAYRCPDCGWWHVGHDSSRMLRKRRRR